MEDRIKQQLAAAIGQDAETLTLTSIEEVEWADSGLGCHTAGMMYMQVITPGYRLGFSDGMQTYEIHTGRNGSPAIWCDRGQPKRLGRA